MAIRGLCLRYRAILTLFPSLFLLFDSFAQTTPDSLVIVFGTVYNEQTKEPIQARITYEKLPYGDDYGIANSGADGKYEVVLMNNNKYNLIIKSPGFVTFKESLMIEEPESEDSITVTKDFYLIPGGVGQIIRMKSLHFGQSTSEIPEGAFEEINSIIALLKENPKMVIQLEGHTDFRGNSKLNHQLSEQRVEAIRSYMMSKGIDKKRIKVKAFGGTVPLTKEDSEEGRKANRRVEVRVLEV